MRNTLHNGILPAWFSPRCKSLLVVLLVFCFEALGQQTPLAEAGILPLSFLENKPTTGYWLFLIGIMLTIVVFQIANSLPLFNHVFVGLNKALITHQKSINKNQFVGYQVVNLPNDEIILQQQRILLARDLHDGIGTQLTHILNRLDIMSITDQHPNIIALSDFVRNANRQLRETIWIYNQEDIAAADLWQRLLNYFILLANDDESPKFNTHFESAKNPVVSHIIASSVFQITQEALCNALKYAQAAEISICLNVDARWLTLLIKDNGRGFSPKKTANGYGLNNMKRRTEELRGNFSLRTSPKGTCITIKIPLR